MFRAPNPRAPRLAVSLTGLALLAATAGCQAQAAQSQPAATAPSTVPSPPAPTATLGEANSIEGLPGTLFYANFDTQSHVRLTPTGAKPAHRDGVPSPDGARTAWIDQREDESFGTLMVTDVQGQSPRALFRHVEPVGYGPAWSPDGTSLLIAKHLDTDSDDDTRPGLVSVASGRFTALPKLNPYLHFEWSGDGHTLAFTTGECRLLTSRADGSGIRQIPVLGDDDRTKNPAGVSACDVVSVNHDGSRITVDLIGNGEPSGDIAGAACADTVIDTATGAAVALPVHGTMLAALYRPDGNLLVRTRAGDKTTLTLFAPDNTVLAAVAEPASMRKYDLVDYSS
jgi:TolB protein